jgi:NAD(P)-dependent dehydrogenase (short-subunit alcohol dehydrogenase family)
MIREVLAVIGAGGMGAAIARRLGSGRRVVLADCDPDGLRTLANALVDDGFEVVVHVVDVTDASAVTDMANATADCGPVVAVVHTAGVSPARASVGDILRVDLLGTAHVLDAFGDVIAPHGAGVVIASMAGTILGGGLSNEDANLLASTTADALLDVPAIRALLNSDGDTADSRRMAYGIAKRGNQLRVQAAASRWGVRGARINSISPGVISTAMGRAELADSATGEAISAMISSSPARRVGTVGDIAAIAEFLLSTGAGFITGTDVLADGGVVASMLTLQLPVPA